MHAALMIWVCESCGDVWHQIRGEQPARDHDGRPLCESCALCAAVPKSKHRRVTP